MSTLSVRQQLAENRLVYYLWRYRSRYLLGFATLLGASVASLLPPFIVRYAVDGITEGTTRRFLFAMAALILGLAAIESYLRFHSRLLVSGASRHIEYDLRNELADKLLSLDQRFYLRSRTGDLMARCTNDLQWVRDFIGPTLVDVVRSIVMVTLGVGLLLTIDVRLALIAVAYLPIVAALAIVFETGVERRFMEVQEQFGVLTDRSQENISGIRAIKAYAQEHAEIAAFGRANDEMLRRSMRLARYTSGLFPIMIFLTGGGTMLVVWFGGHDVASGRITVGQFVMFNIVLALLANQLTVTGWIAAAWQQGIVAARRINQVLNELPAIADPDDPTVLAHVRGDVAFEGVTVRYGERMVLDGIDLAIPAGKRVALVGATGAGKTTLVNLLARLADPDAGRVTIDGTDVRQLRLQQLRDAIGFVPQESFLFSDSLRENIALGRLDPPPEDVHAALETSQLVNDLGQLDGGLETLIGERGATLSGGQKQRAALTRALLKNPPILVLDDALSHVDTHTEEEILKRLRAFMRGRTTIVIAHRTSTLQDADMIVALEGGRIVETGTHDELLERGGVYSRFYREQRRAELTAGDVEASVIDEQLASTHDGARDATLGGADA
ncbi:MAG: ABC transporter ATP-binding protein [Chloroflexi bacterium]|nr:ABC transporter ATP-binding protein [Chloroflexota bacterium]MDA1003715.1 ABC transporter ATP-binding protein [Chloroflexota bacterium]